MAVIASGGLTVGQVERPKPPAELTQAQATEWNAIVSRLPPDWFPRESHGLLMQYVRRHATAQRVAAMVDECERGGIDELRHYDRLLRMQDRETKALMALATKLRITQQSTISKKRQKPVEVKKPWQS